MSTSDDIPISTIANITSAEGGTEITPSSIIRSRPIPHIAGPPIDTHPYGFSSTIAAENQRNPSASKAMLSFKDIKKFSGIGDECVSDFIFRFRKISVLNNYSHSDQLHVLPLLLEGQSLTVYRTLNPT